MTPSAPNRLSRVCATGIAVLSWYALLLQFYLSIVQSRSVGIPTSTAILNFFSFFTILTNLLVALVLTISVGEKASALRSFCSRPRVQSATAVYILIVGIVYSLVLRDVWDPRGLQKLADILLHDAIPVLYVLYWFFFVPKNEVRFGDIPPWLVYPGIYLVYSMIRGAITGRYPYPFVDASELGYARVVWNALAITAGFLAASLLMVAIGRWMARRSAD